MSVQGGKDDSGRFGDYGGDYGDYGDEEEDEAAQLARVEQVRVVCRPRQPRSLPVRLDSATHWRARRLPLQELAEREIQVQQAIAARLIQAAEQGQLAEADMVRRARVV